MGDRRNVLIDAARVVAAAGIVLCHADMTVYGTPGILAGQFLSVRFPLMFFLALIGFYTEKAYQAGKSPVRRRVVALSRVYAAWSLLYMALSFVMLVLRDGMPLGQYLVSRVKGFFFTGSYYHFWFYPAVIYALLFIGLVKRLLGRRALQVLVPLSVVLYAVGLLGTGYLPLGSKIPGLRALYAWAHFEPVMHLVLLGFPSVVFGMAAAHMPAKRPGWLLFAAGAYVLECVLLCLTPGWQQNPQMLLTTPVLTALFLAWADQSSLLRGKGNPMLLRTVSAGMYNVHPLLLAGFSMVLPGLHGLGAFALCAAFSALLGWALYLLRKKWLVSLFI